MRILVLGGTRFLSRAVAAEAARRGHDVVCACRGISGDVPDGAALVRWDRAQPAPDELLDGGFAAVVDVARQPSYVRSAVAALPAPHWIFVSSISAYADDSLPGGPGTVPLREPITDDVDLATDPEAYGGLKVACEDIVTAGADSSTIVRPGLIVGPGDPSGRFSYWPRRLADGGEVLAPGSPDAVVQVIDVRDLAGWIVTLAETRQGGVYDGVGEPMPMAELLARCAPAASYTWVGQEFLQEQGVDPWSGPDSIPVWLPRPEYDGMLHHDVEPALRTGLTLRPIADTARDTLAWLAATPDAPITGITREREAELLALWRERADRPQ